jgi:hypothetical protein
VTQEPVVNHTESTTPLLDRIAARAEKPRQPRWLRLQAERIAREGGSRWEATKDLTAAGTVL